MRDSFLSPDLIKKGARHELAGAPSVITVEWLQTECARLERMIRKQPFEWPEGAEQELEALKPVRDTASGLRIWALLKHLYRVRSEGLTAPKTQDTAEVARQILMREPVVVQLAGRAVKVTGRSYAAMAHIAQHDIRGRVLWLKLERLAALVSITEARHRASSVFRRGKHSRRLDRLAAVHEDLFTEWMKHRASFYAHALTEHGGPADDGARPPSWFRHTTREDDAVLLGALFEVGPARYNLLGPPPERKDSPDPLESFGFASLISAWDRDIKLGPAALYDHDLGQVLTQMRAGNPPFNEKED